MFGIAPMSFRPGSKWLTHLPALALVLLLFGQTVAAQGEAGVGTAYLNGRWFDGKEFRPATFYVVDGHLTRRRPARIETTLDLRGRYVIPPFGDAHQHIFNDAGTVAAETGAFLGSGVFYVMVQDSIGAVPAFVRERVNRPAGVDVVYTTAPLIGPGHGLIDYFESLRSADEKENGSDGPAQELYFAAADRDALARQWPRVLELNPHFIKVIVAFSEVDAKRRGDERYYTDPALLMARPGLPPGLLPEVVERAHRAGRRVSVHVETAADFRLAVAAGADLIAHLPGWHVGPTAGFEGDPYKPWLITDADARAAAEAGTAVITTVYPKPFFDNEKLADTFRHVQRENLRRLRDAGAVVAIGSDNPEAGVLGEAERIAGLGVFDNLKMIEMLTATTPRAIFPKRRIGRLEEGFEASFLVLEKNPLEDLAALRETVLIVKQGRVLKNATRKEKK